MKLWPFVRNPACAVTMKRKKTSRSLVFVMAVVAWGVVATNTRAQSVDDAMTIQGASQQHSQRSQEKIDALADSRQAMADEYRALVQQTDELGIYNAQLRRLIQSQEIEISQYDADLAELEQTRRRLMPLLWQMTEALGQIISVDTPFLADERQTRLQELTQLMDRADIAVADKYRRIMEAYQIEAEYGHSIEAYQGQMHIGDEVRTVDFLRFGRVGLYYLSLDGQEVGMWSSAKGNWLEVDAMYKETLAQAIRIARKQMPPDLIRLPVPAPVSAQPQVVRQTEEFTK